MKTGYKTTEFWLSAITALVVILNESGLFGTFLLPTEAIVSVAGIVISYVLARTVAKVKIDA